MGALHGASNSIPTTMHRQIQASKHIVIFTGAGISTPCGLPDFRGPRGIWTLRKKGLPLPPLTTPFFAATPSYTHMAIVTLVYHGLVNFVVSQNVDGLHVRSGIPLSALAELHGNCFVVRLMKLYT
jgi:mono-ADP-ribosyltransferase sirtuin 6